MHLRIRGPAELVGMNVLRGNWGARVETQRISEVDLVLIQRDFPRFWSAYRDVIQLTRRMGKFLIYELDDLLFELPEDHSHRHDYSGALTAMLAAVSDSDLVTVSSEELREYIRKINPNVRVLRNYLDDRIWPIRSIKKTDQDDSPIIVGYMGGETHQSDLEMIEPVLKRMLNKYGDRIAFRFWGGKPPAGILSFSSTDWTAIDELDYRRFAGFFANQDCDIVIAPLRDTSFNRAKSGIKFLEYSALGKAGVYSRLPPYQTIVDDGVSGFLAGSEEEWETALCRLIESPELRFQIGSEAQKTLMAGWLLRNHANEWIAAYNEAMKPDDKAESRDNGSISTVLSQSAMRFEQMERELIFEKNQGIARDQQLKEILESRSWRLISWLQRLRLWLIPKNSRRESLLVRLFK